MAGTNHYRYPANVEFDAHIDISAFEYHFIKPGEAHAQPNQLQRAGCPFRCSLYAPGGMHETITHDWGNEEILHAYNRGAGGGEMVSGSINQAAKMLLGGAGTSFSNTLMAGTGMTLAPNEMMIFKGSKNKMIQLSFEMVPKNAFESLQIASIIDGMKTYSLPNWKINGSFSYLAFPHLFDLLIFTNAQSSNTGTVRYSTKANNQHYLPQYTSMALLSMAVIYGQGSQSLLFNWNGSPVSVTLTLDFQSIRPAFNLVNATAEDVNRDMAKGKTAGESLEGKQ